MASDSGSGSGSGSGRGSGRANGGGSGSTVAEGSGLWWAWRASKSGTIGRQARPWRQRPHQRRGAAHRAACGWVLAVERGQRRTEEVDGETWLDQEERVVVVVWCGVVWCCFKGSQGRSSISSSSSVT
jgi:hypothetical protein